MIVRLPTHAAAAALLAFALGTAPALAQTTTDQQPTTQTPAQAQPPAATPAPAPAPAGKTTRRMTRLEDHIAEMHRQLHITADEQPQWDAFAQVMRDNAERMDQAFKARATQGVNMNAIDDLRSYAAIAQAHADDMQRLVPAFEKLYGTLTPAQQKEADVMFRSFERRGKRRGPG